MLALILSKTQTVRRMEVENIVLLVAISLVTTAVAAAYYRCLLT